MLRMNRAWRALHQEARCECCHSVFLERFAQGEISEKRALEFAVQRYLKALGFVNVLAMLVIRTIRASEYTAINLAAARNLRDELGLWRQPGEVTDPWELFITQSHEVHRQAFYQAWGVSQEVLMAARSNVESWLVTTRVASDMIGPEFAFHAPILELAGWLTMAEYVLPGELTQILRGLEVMYPDRFSDPSNPATQEIYSTTELEAMRYARWYVEDHIRHDAGAHSQEMEEALKFYLEDSEGYHQIERGARRVIQMNQVFYSGF